MDWQQNLPYRAMIYLFQFQMAMEVAYRDPATGLPQMRAIRQALVDMDEMLAVLYCDHWLLQIMLYNTQQYAEALEMGISVAMEARKPQYAAVSERIGVHCYLVRAYLGIDPVGYAQPIADMLRYLNETSDGDYREFILQLECEFALVHGKTDEALQVAKRYIAVAEETAMWSNFYLINGHMLVCMVALAQSDWALLQRHSEMGLKLKPESEQTNRHRAALMAALALALHKRDTVTPSGQTAATWAALAQNEARTTTTNMNPFYYDALCAYLEALPDVSAALDQRQQQVTGMAGKGMAYWEARARLEQIRLRKQSQAQIEPQIDDAALKADIAAAHAVIKQLKAPDALRDALKRLSGDTDA